MGKLRPARAAAAPLFSQDRECRHHLAHCGYWERDVEPNRDCSLDVTNDGPHTIDEVAVARSMSTERVRQLEQHAFQSLRFEPTLRQCDDGTKPRSLPDQAQARSAMSDLLTMQRAVWRAKRSTTEKIVLLAVLDHYSDSSPEPWPSVARLAEHCGLGGTSMLDALASLEGAGALRVRRVVCSVIDAFDPGGMPR